MPSEAERPFIVAGMHRSGTSLTASVLAACGVDMGSDLLPADAQNVPGYFEDRAFLAFQRKLLTRACTSQDGWPDWGFCRSGRLDGTVVAAAEDEARRLAASRMASARTWGWKDPRTTMLLDLWADVFPAARFVLVYRAPWDVLDSIRRIAHPAQLDSVSFGLRAWTAYNWALLRFRERHEGACVVVAAEGVARDTPSFVQRIQRRLGALPKREAVVVRKELLLSAGFDDPRVAEALKLAPEVETLYRALEETSDLPAGSALPVASRSAASAAFRPGARLSVVIPCFNQGEYLLDAVASVEAVPGGRHELLIVNDGSDDQLTPPILQHLRDRGHCVLDQDNQGLAAARNAGIAAAHGEYVLPLDADNELLPPYVERGPDILDAAPATAVVYGDMELLGEKSGRKTVGDFDIERLAAGNFIDACAVIRKSAWADVHGYDPAFGWEDWDLWLRIAQRGRWAFRYVPDLAFRYRVRSHSMLSSAEARPERLREMIAFMAAKHRAFFEPRWPAIWGTLVGSLTQLRGSYENALTEIASLRSVIAARDTEIANLKALIAAQRDETR
jgi:GT2 family glycosyltransferase